MLFKVMSVTGFRGDAVEYTREEQVIIKNGIGICRTEIARDTLFIRGYDFIEEIPLELTVSDTIPDELYTDRKYAVIQTVSEKTSNRGRPKKNDKQVF